MQPFDGSGSFEERDRLESVTVADATPPFPDADWFTATAPGDGVSYPLLTPPAPESRFVLDALVAGNRLPKHAAPVGSVGRRKEREQTAPRSTGGAISELAGEPIVAVDRVEHELQPRARPRRSRRSIVHL